jgi:mannose/cellobiose epimerase-like protein (N-acyl-D-glucosamine 2-epimerase family)
MDSFYQSISLYGTVTEIATQAPDLGFTLTCRSGDQLAVKVGPTTSYQVLTNLDNLNRDRVKTPDSAEPKDAVGKALRALGQYIKVGRQISLQGIYQEENNKRYIKASTIYLPHSAETGFLFEETHWWIDQVSQLADKWLDNLFDSTRSYKIDDFSKFYRTNLNITGEPTDDTIQECATLSRLIYGLSSAYLLTGSERYFLAAKAGIDYQREAYRSLSHDGEYCFWAFGRRKVNNGSKLVVPSENGDDAGTIPLYEQIYALAGLAQFYRITQDWRILDDIRRTVKAFMAFYHDSPAAKENGFPGRGGFFSHIDYATMRPDTPGLKDNCLRKNWNSIGDHIPAYLVNLLLALDPLPRGPNNESLREFRDLCESILRETAAIIVEEFPGDKEGKVASKYVDERFDANFVPDHKWGWQQNRAICGHNLKIAWNLSRVAFYYQTKANEASAKDAGMLRGFADKCLGFAAKLGTDMADLALDKLRGGIFDAVERNPRNGMPVEFAWGSTKDFWQQEQGILAYLILMGAAPAERPKWLELARESMMFWNLFFLDRDRQGIYFRTTENGSPVIEGAYANKGGHSVSGYHAFELNYLAHIYIRSYLIDGNEAGDNAFCLYFRIASGCEQESINVLPDFFPPQTLEIHRIRVNGVDRTSELKPHSASDFQVPLKRGTLPDSPEIAVEFKVRA